MRRLAVLLVLAATSIVLAVFGTGAGSARHSSKVRVSVGIDTAYAPMFVAKHYGIFRKHGLDVDLVQFAQGGEGVDAMIAGTIDAGGSGDATVLGKSTRGPLKAFAIFQESGDYIKVAVRREITNVRQIRRIGIVPGSLSQYGAFRLLDYFRIPRTSVRFVSGGPPEMPALLSRGDIDAFVMWEPWPSRAVELGGRVLMRTKAFRYSYVLFLLGSANWFENHRADARKLVRAIAEASRRIEASPRLAAVATQREVRIPAEDSLKAVREIDFGVRDFTASDLASFERISDFLLEQRIVRERPNARELVVRGFVRAALTPKGTRRADVLTGTLGPDSISGRAGNDRIFGLAGDDRLAGGAGDDRVEGGLGNDTLVGGPGSDRLNGGAGNDVILARDGRRDVVRCGAGRDVARADGNDRLIGCERR